MNLPEVHYLITESTYAQREHPDRQGEERKMMKTIKETLSNGGVAIVSSFAIARAQEILLILDEYEPKEKIYVDGMAQKATRIIAQYPELQREYNIIEKALERLEIQTINPRKRKKILKKPCIIITTSGMLSGGPVVHYLEKLYDKENCSLILTGFQVPGTEGAVLLETGHYIHGDLDLELKMNVRKFDFSSHASRTELFRFVKHLNPEKVFCVHGDNTEGFSEELKEDGFDAIAPKDDRIFNLD
jgi:putative mRNA 3-end processing factor